MRIATFHRLKGLEFPRVLLSGVQDHLMPMRFPAWYQLEPEKQAEHDKQQRCLLYVAATRARDELAITGYGRPSPFLATTPAATPDAPELDLDAEKTCPRCGASGSVGELFGTRRITRRLVSGDVKTLERAQSYCRGCR